MGENCLRVTGAGCRLRDPGNIFYDFRIFANSRDFSRQRVRNERASFMRTRGQGLFLLPHTNTEESFTLWAPSWDPINRQMR